MKLCYSFLIIGLLSISIIGCSKYKIDRSSKASLSVVNVISAGQSVTFNWAPLYDVKGMSYQTLPFSGGDHVYLSAYPTKTPASLYWDTDLNASEGELYTLLLSGSTNTKVDPLFYKEGIIPKFTDSIAGVRFINLVQNSNPIAINVKGLPPGSAVPHLSYQQIGAFDQYPALDVNSTYTFEIRDAQTGALLDSYVLNTPRFKSCTLIWKGIIKGAGDAEPEILRIDQ